MLEYLGFWWNPVQPFTQLLLPLTPKRPKVNKYTVYAEKKVLLEWGNSALFSSTGKWKISLIITCKLMQLFTVTIYNAILIWNIFPCPICYLTSGEKSRKSELPFCRGNSIPYSIFIGNAIIHLKQVMNTVRVCWILNQNKRHHIKRSCWIWDLFFIIIYCTKEQRGSFTISLSALKKSVVFTILKPKSVFIIGLDKCWRFVHLLIRQHRH